jgi:hypothetical protein
MARRRNKGVSLVKGPVAIIGMILLAYGVTGMIFGGQGFAADPLNGTVNGDTWLGLEVNGWSNLLFIGAGGLLLFGAPLHLAAKTLSMLVGLGLAAIGVISAVDGDDALGIFAANGRTSLVWIVAGAVLVVVALLPRVGGEKRTEPAAVEPDRAMELERTPQATTPTERIGRHVRDPQADDAPTAVAAEREDRVR